VKLAELRAFGFDPFGGTGFDDLSHLGNGQRSREAKEKMDVVLYTANSKGGTILVGQDGGQVGMQFRSNCRGENRCSVLGTENHVDENTGQ
jgi:hypothetical protein